MEKIIALAGGIPQSKARSDDGIIDRLNHRYTISMLVIFSLVVSSKQFVGDRINCWTPAHFSKTWLSYAESYCWIKNTYYLSFEDNIPKAESDYEDKQMITYYQWVPLLLLVQALVFYIPCMIWRTFNNRSGVDLNNMVESGLTFLSLDKCDSREKTLNYMTRQMNRYLSSKREYSTEWTVSLKNCFSRICCAVCGRKRGNYLVTLYLFVKLLYVANVIMQLFALNAFLGTDFNMYGINVLRSAANGQDWTASPRFPRVTMCDFNVRRLGNVQRYTLQCVLPINLFNEKIYLFVWFWFVFVAVMTCLSFLIWLLRIALQSDRFRYIKKHLLIHKKISDTGIDDDRVKKFANKYLRQDGVFVLRLVGHNTNSITATEFVCALWNYYVKHKEKRNGIYPNLSYEIDQHN